MFCNWCVAFYFPLPKSFVLPMRFLFDLERFYRGNTICTMFVLVRDTGGVFQEITFPSFPVMCLTLIQIRSGLDQDYSVFVLDRNSRSSGISGIFICNAYIKASYQ